MPLEELTFELPCPHCSQKFPFTLRQVLGEETVTCPHCQSTFQLKADSAERRALERSLKELESQWEKVRQAFKKLS